MNDRPPPRITALANGLRVVTQDMPAIESVSVGVWVDAGARHEVPSVNGVSHLIEHMVFKGTPRRSARAIAEEIEAVGGHMNAYTTREHTAYYAKVLKDDLPLALDLLADIVQHSLFDEGELGREREVVIQEIGQAHDTPDDIVHDYFQETAFPDQPLGRPVLGSAEGVAGLTRGALLGYLAEHYTAGRMVLAAAGRLDHDRLVALARNLFSDLPAGDGASFDAARYAGGESRHGRTLEQVHVLLGFNGLAYEDPDFYALQVLSTLLGGGMSSRLFQEVREERGLAYSIYSFASSYLDGGLFGVYAGLNEENCTALMDIVCHEVRAVAAEVEEAEVARARAQLKSGLLMALESSSARCEQLARQMLIFGRPVPTEELVARIEAVDAVAASACMARLLGSGRPTLTVLGPVGGFPDYEQVRRRLA